MTKTRLGITALSTLVAGILPVICFVAYAGTAVAGTADDADGERRCIVETRDAQGFREFAACEAKRTGLPPQVATAVMEIESGFNPDTKGAAGEVGLMQVMPPTARMLGFLGDANRLADPAVNIAIGVRYLAKAHRLAGGDLCTTFMKYRAGHAETRFSARSVAYCLRARKILSRDGYQVAGKVPVATFGFASTAARGAARMPASLGFCARRILVPGPRFRRCTDVPSVKVTRHTLARPVARPGN